MKLALFAVILVLFFATGVITLLGIVQRVKIEQKYLNKLFSTLILELVLAVIYLFGETDFYSDTALSSDEQQRLTLLKNRFPDMPLVDIDKMLDSSKVMSRKLSDSQDDLKQTQLRIEQLQHEIDTLNAQITEKYDQNQWLSKELEIRKGDTLRLLKLERLFLVRMAELSSKIGEWGTSVNLRWQSDEKRDIALMLQEAFKEIGFMPELEIPNDDPLLAYDILIRYQKTKEFKECGFLTQQTVAYIIQDYLASANSHFL